MINNQNNFYYIIFYFIGYYGVISCKIKKEAHFRRVTLQKNAFVHAGIIATDMVFVNVFFHVQTALSAGRADASTAAPPLSPVHFHSLPSGSVPEACCHLPP